MTDTESDSDEISQGTDTLLGEIMTEVLPKEEVQPAPDSQPSVTRDSPTNSTAEDILDILLADARMPISEIADQADVSEPTVRKYIDRLESKDIIVGYSVDVNPENLRNQTVSLVRIEIDRAAIEDNGSACFHGTSAFVVSTQRRDSGDGRSPS